MAERLNKADLVRLNSIEPPIDPDVVADTLCDGELLAAALDRWVVCDFVVIHGILFNRAIMPVPDEARVAAAVERFGAFEAEVRLTTRFDFQIINDPACPRPVLAYLMRMLAMLWEAQARREHPERDVRMEAVWKPEEGFGAFAIVQRSHALPAKQD